MAEGGKTRVRVIKNAPTTSKADIWAHFGFYEQPGKHDLKKTHAVCKSCHAQIKYARGNTTNLRNNVSRFHPELLTLSVPSIYFYVFVLNAPVVFCAQI